MPTWNSFFKFAGRKNDKALKPDDLPNHDEFGDNSSIFNNRRTLAAKAASEPRLRCTEVDEHGNVILVDGEFKKTELIAKVWANIQTLRSMMLTLPFF
jgi:magnesium transporter